MDQSCSLFCAPNKDSLVLTTLYCCEHGRSLPSNAASFA
ncbi:unnamed protein product, partial [Larinioides sclopetarius]